MFKSSFKQFQVDKTILDACSITEKFLTTKCRTINLLSLVLPIGWRVGKPENKVRFIERDLQIKQSDINNVYMTIKRNKIHIYQFFESNFNKDFITVRLNIVINELDQIEVI